MLAGRLFWIVLLGITFALLILVARHNGGSIAGLADALGAVERSAGEKPGDQS